MVRRLSKLSAIESRRIIAPRHGAQEDKVAEERRREEQPTPWEDF